MRRAYMSGDVTEGVRGGRGCHVVLPHIFLFALLQEKSSHHVLSALAIVSPLRNFPLCVVVEKRN